MGRKADAPGVQAAKGHPGKRKTAIEKRMEQLDALARVLAAAPAPASDPMAPPILEDPVFAPALEIWRRNAPEMVRTNRLPLESRDYFAALCIYTAEYWELALDVARNGKWQRVKRTNNSWEEKPRPAMSYRDAAHDNMLKLATHFGMTPREMYALYKDQALAAQSNPGLFGQAEKPATAPEAQPSLLGSAGRLRSEPPAGHA